MPTALRGHARRSKLSETLGRPRLSEPFGCHAHGFAWACETQQTIRNTGRPRLSEPFGCHAHGFAWACETQQTIRNSRPAPAERTIRVPCPRLCVGMRDAANYQK